MTRTAARRARPSPSLCCSLPLFLTTLTLLLGLLVHSPAWADEAVGVLSVTGNVDGAEVWVDGEQVGALPYTGYHPVGNHQVRVVADNYDPFVRKVELIDGLTKSLKAKLVAGKGTVEFSVTPPGATVLIDGNAVGPAPIRIRDLAQGTHRYRIVADGYEPMEDSFEFATGRNLLFDLELLSSAGLFHVGSTPAGATVWIDGEQVGTTPLDVSGIPLGEHHVRLALDGYADVFRPVDTTDGRKGSLEASLSERGGKLTVKTGADDAVVSANGCELGQGSRVVLPRVDRGTLQLQVTRAGYEPATLSVRLPGNGATTVKADLAPTGDGRSELTKLAPFYGRWTFWAATAAVAGGGVAGGVILAKALEPPPPPEGDVLVVLP